MPDVAAIVADLYAWAARYGLLTDAGMREAAMIPGDPSQVPFDEDEAEFFRLRKIMRIRADELAGRRVVTIFTRQAIAERKVQRLIRAFTRRHPDLTLAVATAPTYRIDQTLQSYGPFEPVRLDDGRIACGSSVGIGNQRNAGTLTALARSTTALAGSTNKRALFGISCNHVVGGCSTAQPGTPIVIPGIQDVTVEFPTITVVGTHYAAATMSPGLPTVLPDISSNGDLACFELSTGGAAQLTSRQGTGPASYDTPIEFADAVTRGLTVQKWGRSTGHTTGTVASVLTDPEPLEYNVVSYFGPQNSQVFRGTIYYQSAYEVQGRTGRPFSVGGDSGALVVTAGEGEPRVVGIVIAGSTGKTLVLPLASLLDQLDLELVNGHPATRRRRQGRVSGARPARGGASSGNAVRRP